ncbi:MAG: response regulator [Bacteroidota bacterium]
MKRNIILDINMPGMNGIEIYKVISKNFPGNNVIMLSLNDENLYSLPSRECGAIAFVDKNAKKEILFSVINEVPKDNKKKVLD